MLPIDHDAATRRRCPVSCEFCASSIRLTPAFKVKPVERVIAEIRVIKEFWRSTFIEFADGNIFANKVHGTRLLRALGSENVRWFTETDISVADDEELLSLLHDAGCAQLLIGIEAPWKQYPAAHPDCRARPITDVECIFADRRD